MPTALTVEFIGSRVATLETTTNTDAVKITAGGSGPTPETADSFIQGTAAVGATYGSSDKLILLAYDEVGAGGSTFDFISNGGNASGQLISVWANAVFTLASTGTQISSNYGGLGIMVESNANLGTDYAIWSIYGSENYPGGYQKLIIDPSLRPTASGGTPDLTAVRWIGIAFTSVQGKAGVQGVQFDAIDIGSGLRIYGSGTPDAGFKDLLDADEGTVDNRYGVIKSLEATETILQLQGYLEIGSGQNAFTRFDDINRVVTFNNPQYIDTTSSPQYVNAIPTSFQKINIVGNTTSGTFVNLGEKVGAGDTARGRNGVTFLGNNEFDISFSFDDGNVDQTRLYGTSIRNFNGTLDWSLPESGHEFIGSIIDGCSQYNASSGVVIRNSTFQNHTGNDGAFLYNSGTDIKNSNFLANANSIGSGAAIQHPFSGSFIYDNLTFSDNDFDINFSLSTSGDLVIQATNGADPATSKKGNVNSTVDIQNTVLLTLTDIVVGSEVRLYKSSPTGTFPTELAGIESEDDGTFLYAYNYTGDFNADIVVVNTGYVYFRQDDNTLTSTPATIKINQIFDRNYENP